MKNYLPKTILLLYVFTILTSCAVKKHVNIWMVGDSTMAAKKPSRKPESGWGEGLKEYVNKKATIKNYAASGRSTLSFINEKRWLTVYDSLSKGDFVVIQFGHNDEKPAEKLHTKPFGSFKHNIKLFIDNARAKGAFPMVCSSIVRRQFDENGILKDTHGDYITAAKQVAQENNIPYIDMELLTKTLVQKLGVEDSKRLYNYTKRKQDSTHLNFNGASKVAELFVRNAKKQNLPIAKYFLVKAD